MPTITINPNTVPTALGRGFLPSATTLEPTVDAVKTSLADLDEGELLAVPVGDPLDNFDIVEWCASNRKHVVNRFDPWPLEYLLIENTPES